MDTFEMYYEKFMKMRKADIIREGQTWEIPCWTPGPFGKAGLLSPASFLKKVLDKS